MSEEKSEKVESKEFKKFYRVKYTLANGEVRSVDREITNEADFLGGSWSDMVKNLLLWLVIAVVLVVVMNTFSNDAGRVSAVNLKKYIVASVQNGAGLDVVKRIYDNRTKTSESAFAWFESKDLSYPYDIPLSSVLEDIRADLYLGSEKPSEDFVAAINDLIFSYGQQNPFDKLTKQQKDYFENVRQKTGASYGAIQGEMNSISDELHSQKQLVDTYLSDSKTSLYISIFSLLFALLVSGYQIYQGRPRKVAESLKILLEDIFTKGARTDEPSSEVKLSSSKEL